MCPGAPKAGRISPTGQGGRVLARRHRGRNSCLADLRMRGMSPRHSLPPIAPLSSVDLPARAENDASPTNVWTRSTADVEVPAWTELITPLGSHDVK